MIKFYLRQTVLFKIIDLPILFSALLTKNQNTTNLVEKEILKITKTKHLVLADSMRSVLLKSLEFFKIKNPEKNEILLPEYSFHSNLSSAVKAGFKIKFIPVNKKTLLIESEQLEKLITQKTLGIIITHVHGKVYVLENIKKIINKYNLIIFEDCAHVFPLQELALTDKKINDSAIKCLSFGPGKFVTAFGGGGLATNNQALFKYVKLHTIKNENFAKKINIFIKACIYTLISNPIIAYFSMKPILALSYSFGLKKNEADAFDQSTYKPNQISALSEFQQKIILLQLKKLNKNLTKTISQRKNIAKKWFSLLKTEKLNKEFCFQFPILVNHEDRFIWQMWHQNIDVQKDYCTYLPSLMKKQFFSQKDANFFQKIFYLPTNQHLSIKQIEKIKI